MLNLSKVSSKRVNLVSDSVIVPELFGPAIRIVLVSLLLTLNMFPNHVFLTR